MNQVGHEQLRLKLSGVVVGTFSLINWFLITKDVRQGCVLSPLMFITYKDIILNMTNQKPYQLNQLLFADDQSLIHRTQLELQNQINILSEKIYRT